MWIFSVSFLVDDSKLNVFCFVDKTRHLFHVWLLLQNNRSVSQTGLRRLHLCRVDSGPNARFESQVKPVASVGQFKEADPSFQNQTKKCWCIYRFTFGVTCCVFSPGLVPHLLLFLLRFCPLISNDSALDWSRTLWWFWLWLVWIFSHTQLSNFTPVQLKTWWNSRIQSESTNRDAGQKLILVQRDRVRSYKSSVSWTPGDIRTSCRGTIRRSLARSQAWLCTTRLVQTAIVNKNQCGSTQLDPTAPVKEPWLCPAASSRDTWGFFFCVRDFCRLSIFWFSFPPNCH